MDGGFWINDQFVENAMWFEVLSVFHSAPASVSEFALQSWTELKPFAVDQLIVENKITVANKTTGAVVNQTITFGNDTAAVYSGQPLTTSLPVGRVVSNGTIFEGVLSNNQFNGWVRFILPNGDYYQGFAKNNLPDGPGNFTKAINKFSEAGFYSKGEFFESQYLFNLSKTFESEPNYPSLKPEMVALWRKLGKFELHEYIHQGKYKLPTEDQGPISVIQTNDAVYTGQVNNGINGIGTKVSSNKIEEGMFQDG